MATDVFSAPSRQGLPPGPTAALHRAAPPEPPHPAQRAASALGWANLSTGLMALAGPAVTGNGDRLVNRHEGKLLGLATVDPTHALMHVAMGAAGIAAARSPRHARMWLWGAALFFGTLAAMGASRARGRGNRPFRLMGMPVDRNGTLVHGAIAASAVAGAWSEHRAHAHHEFARRHAL